MAKMTPQSFLEIAGLPATKSAVRALTESATKSATTLVENFSTRGDFVSFLSGFTTIVSIRGGTRVSRPMTPEAAAAEMWYDYGSESDPEDLAFELQSVASNLAIFTSSSENDQLFVCVK